MIKMQTSRFNEYVEKRIEKIRAVLLKKGVEYTVGDNRFSNFLRAANMLKCSQEKALIGMAAKHIISILDEVDKIDSTGNYPTEALIDEKIGDAINYLILLEAMIKGEIGYKELTKAVERERMIKDFDDGQKMV